MDEVVPGDLIRLAPGDQVVADGGLVAAEGLALDESILALEGLAGRRGRLVAAMCGALLGGYAAVLAVPFAREFFELAVPSVEIVATAVVGAALAVAGLELMGLRQDERRQGA